MGKFQTVYDVIQDFEPPFNLLFRSSKITNEYILESLLLLRKGC